MAKVRMSVEFYDNEFKDQFEDEFKKQGCKIYNCKLISYDGVYECEIEGCDVPETDGLVECTIHRINDTYKFSFEKI